MRKNLIDSINSEVTTMLIDKISNYLGESRENTSQGVTALTPSLLGFLVQKSKDETFSEKIFNLSSQTDLIKLFQDSSFTEVFEKNRHALMQKGDVLIREFFNEKELNMVKDISEYADISEESTKGIMASMLPFILKLIGDEISEQNLNASEVSTFLDQQFDSIYDAMPVGLNSLFTRLGFIKSSSKTSENAPYHMSEESQVSEEIEKERRMRFDEDDKDDEKGETVDYLKWLLPILGILAALALLWFVMSKFQEDKTLKQKSDQDSISWHENFDNKNDILSS